ncbi:hypothetical protein [Limosilactobacillus coleohominis]|uniref:hypothetical protein n=1 Tax=Limosilactobacillus coleohominis TaxID=181675 RepID=UPI0026EA81C6|nr:hypothetical protein [Limosilactobacillus coleohominis]
MSLKQSLRKQKLADNKVDELTKALREAKTAAKAAQKAVREELITYIGEKVLDQFHLESKVEVDQWLEKTKAKLEENQSRNGNENFSNNFH